ncbi:hypothetical protein [Chryseolinea lacunae]|uniref:Uncharacterized protein n=1 Tax=Chryseolinea lacunae TaxID=2801331 RepID=A0ABS1KPE0_9BACT|nr:hypothetical protein [Chryseolinea lacunae]MBL0741229.1 hypothetical protein [Chryseolinea lacunae]
MDELLLKERMKAFCSFMGLTEDTFDFSKIKTEDDWIDEVISVFTKNRRVFIKFLGKVVDLRVRYFFLKQHSIEDIHTDTPVEELFSPYVMENINKVESEVGLEFPSPMLSTFSLCFQTLLILIPAILIVVLLILRAEFLLVLYGIVKVGAVVFILIIPYGLTYLMFPRFFMPSRFYKTKTYDDIIGYVALSNHLFFLENDYQMTKVELRSFISSTM